VLTYTANKEFRPNKRPILIVHPGINVFPPSGYGGGERFAYGLAKLLAKNGFNVMTLDFGVQESITIRDGIRLVRLRRRFYMRNLKGLVSYMNAIFSMCNLLLYLSKKRSSFENPVLYFHGGLEYAIVRRCIKLFIPGINPAYVFRLQSPRWMNPNLLKFWEKILAIPTELFAVTSADLVLFESEAVRSSLRKFWKEPKNSIVIPNAVDTEFFDREKYKSKMVSSGILYAAMIKPQKDQLTVVRAMAKVIRERPDAKLMLVGDAQDQHYYKEVRREVVSLGLSGCVDFVPSTSIENLNRIRSKFPIHLVYSSYTGFDVAVGETMAFGVACIFSRIPTLDGIAKDGINCLLVEPKNDEALAQAILKLLNNGNLIEVLGKNARKSAMELLSWDAFSEILVNEFSQFDRKT